MECHKRDQFWKAFKTRFGRQLPFVAKGVSSVGGIDLSTQQIFNTVLKVTEHVRHGIHLNRIRGSVDGDPVIIQRKAAALLPSRSDSDFEGYHSRVTQFSKTIKYGFVINNLQAFDPIFFEHFCKQITFFFRAMGIPKGGWETTLFFGNYDQTQFGVHLDDALGFMFPILGLKRIRAWSPDQAKKHPELQRALKYEKYKHLSTLLEAEPGDLIHWPQSYWHVGEGTGNFTVALAFPNYVASRGKNRMAKILGKLPTKPHEGRTPFKTAEPGMFSIQYSRAVKRDLHLHREHLSSKKLRLRFQELWMSHLSGYGSIEVPQALGRTVIFMNQLIELDPLFPVLWTRVPPSRGTFLLSCRGRSVTLRQSPFLPSLLRRLNAKVSLRVGELTTSFSSTPGGTAQVRKALQAVSDLGGIRILAGDIG